MIGLVLNNIITDISKDGVKYINSAGQNFYMQHVEIKDKDDNQIWLSKYLIDPTNSIDIEVGSEYDFLIRENNGYYNIIKATKVDS